MGLAAVEHRKLAGPITAGHIFWTSAAIGRHVRRAENVVPQLVSHKHGKLDRPRHSGVARTWDLLKIIA
jgi:hypothetical protein